MLDMILNTPLINDFQYVLRRLWTLFLKKKEVISTSICLPVLVKEEARFELSLLTSHIAKLI